jgi:outer membrane protein assembly factor BamB
MTTQVKWMTQVSRTQGLGRPLLYGDKILSSDLAVNWRSVLYCLSTLDGRVLWQRTLPEAGASATGGTIEGVVLFYRTYEEEGHVRAYSVETGDLVWENERVHWTVVVGSGLITDWWSDKGAEAIASLEPRTGKVIWRRPVTVGTWPEALVGRTMVMIEESGYQERSVVTGVRLEDGVEIWRTDLRRFGCVVMITGGGDGRAYCAVSDGWLVALEVARGDVAWACQFEGGTPNRPVVAHGKVYTTTQGFFHGVDAKTGEVATRAEWKDLLLGDGCVDERHYYAASNDCIVAFELRTGREVWRHNATESDGSFVPPVVYEGHLYAATLKGRVYCLEIA